MNIMPSHNRAALTGLLFVLPFFLMNFIVSLRMQPFFSFLEMFPAIRSSPILPLLLLLLFPAGAYASIRPMLFTEKDGSRKMPIVNCLLSALLLAMFLFLFIPLAKDMYTCEILNIPNCD